MTFAKIALPPLALGLLLAMPACWDDSGDYESTCTVSCDLPDGGAVQTTQTIACCGVHANPSHPNEEGSACTPTWVSTRTQQLCNTFSVTTWDADAGQFRTQPCAASQFHCTCEMPHTYPSYQGCD